MDTGSDNFVQDNVDDFRAVCKRYIYAKIKV